MPNKLFSNNKVILVRTSRFCSSIAFPLLILRLPVLNVLCATSSVLTLGASEVFQACSQSFRKKCPWSVSILYCSHYFRSLQSRNDFGPPDYTTLYAMSMLNWKNSLYSNDFFILINCALPGMMSQIIHKC